MYDATHNIMGIGGPMLGPIATDHRLMQCNKKGKNHCSEKNERAARQTYKELSVYGS